MKPHCVDLLVVLLLSAAAALRPASSAATAAVAEADDSEDYDDPSFNEVDKKSKSSAAAELDNRIPVIFSELSDIERALSAEGSVTGSGELKVTGEHAQSTSASGEANVRIAPKYMLDLYDKFAKDKYSHPMANIVRSFTNMNTDAETVSLSEARNGSRTRRHRLVFNVSSVGRDEDIYLAELRLLTLVETDRSLYAGISRRVTVCELHPASLSNSTTTQAPAYHQITSKLIHGRASGWETFTVTDAVKRWIRLRTTAQVIEVRIESVDRQHDNITSSDDDDDDNADSEDDDVNIDIATRPHSDSEPLLVVFSNDRHHRHFDSRELHEIIEREMELYESGDLPAAAVAAAAELADYNDDDDNDEYVDYDDYEYYDNRVDTEPAGERVVSRVERDIEAISADARPGAPAKRDLATTDETWTRTRVRRAKYRRRLRRNICRRRPMYVNFEDIHWNGWIIEPKGYQAYTCTGRCYFPLSDHLTPTKHAIVQTILNANYPRKAGRACCVPTRLAPISILYVDDQGTVTYKYKYDGMVVAECGCR